MAAISEKHIDQLHKFAPDHARLVERAMRDAKKAEPTAIEGPAAAPEFTIDLSNLTERLLVEDIEDIEEAADLSIEQVFTNMQRGRIKGLAALVWVLRRKEEPDYKLEDARRLPLTKMMEAIRQPEDDTSPLENDAAPSA